MKSFWWFKENKIAGMARPGFNSCRWFDLPFDEAMVMGWLGQHSSGPIPLAAFRAHLDHYIPKVISFYPLDENQRRSMLDSFNDVEALKEILVRLSQRSKFFAHASINDDHLHFGMNEEQINADVQYLKDRNVGRVVSLTELHHLADQLQNHFQVDHIGILDMGAPTRDQAEKLAEILDVSERKGECVAVHCLAGIGRTSTMIMAAELLRGKHLVELLETIRKQNSVFQFVGSQAEFISKLASDLGRVSR